jgi:hypothetical protein
MVLSDQMAEKIFWNGRGGIPDFFLDTSSFPILKLIYNGLLILILQFWGMK